LSSLGIGKPPDSRLAVLAVSEVIAEGESQRSEERRCETVGVEGSWVSVPVVD